MKTINFIIFFGVVLIVLGSVNYYIYRRAYQALPDIHLLKTIFTFFFVFVAVSFIAGRILESMTICQVSEILIHIGSLWLGMMFYFFIAVVFFDELRLLNHFTGFFPSFIKNNYESVKLYLLMGTTAVVFILTIYGLITAHNPKIKNFDLNIDKTIQSGKKIKIVMASDIHLGIIIGKKHLDRLIMNVNALNPDIILLAGDIVDEDIRPVIEENLGESLKNFKSKYGVYAIPGNHEYIGGAEKALAYLSDHGINILKDSIIKINNEIVLIGRDDRSATTFGGRKRKPLSELLRGVDTNLPLILMDHQPFDLEDVSKSGIDLQVSGHTHHGQIWPLSIITNIIYEISWGYKKIGNTHFYVSSGYGTWGPPMKIGNDSEIVCLNLNFR